MVNQKKCNLRTERIEKNCGSNYLTQLLFANTGKLIAKVFASAASKKFKLNELENHIAMNEIFITVRLLLFEICKFFC